MAKRLALIHTVSTLITTFKALCAELMPDVDVFNIVDESLLQDCIRDGQLSAITARRLVSYLVSAELAGADIAMVTCSSLGPAVEMGRPLLAMPVVRVDEPMADQAVRMGRRIGVAATLRTTLDPTASLIRARAAAAGQQAEVVSRLCEGAFQAITAGDDGRHDALVSAGLRELGGQVDVIVLAQASMARVAESLPETGRGIPILSSPRLAVEYLARELNPLH